MTFGTLENQSQKGVAVGTIDLLEDTAAGSAIDDETQPGTAINASVSAEVVSPDLEAAIIEAIGHLSSVDGSARMEQ